MSGYENFPWELVLFLVGSIVTFFAGLFIGLNHEGDGYERGYSAGYEHGYQHGFNNRRQWRDQPLP